MSTKALSNDQLQSIMMLEKAFQKCRKLSIGFFVQESDLLAFSDRQQLIEHIADHAYLRDYNWTVDHGSTIIDCGAWD